MHKYQKLEIMTKPPKSGKFIKLCASNFRFHTRTDIIKIKIKIQLELFLERKHKKCMFLKKPQLDRAEPQASWLLSEQTEPRRPAGGPGLLSGEIWERYNARSLLTHRVYWRQPDTEITPSTAACVCGPFQIKLAVTRRKEKLFSSFEGSVGGSSWPHWEFVLGGLKDDGNT